MRIDRYKNNFFVFYEKKETHITCFQTGIEAIGPVDQLSVIF